MSVKTATNRLIVSSISRSAGFYQQLFKNVSDFEGLGRRLICAAEAAIAYRRIEQVEEASLMLSRLPVKEYQLIGQHYLGWSVLRRGGNARSILENVVENSKTYRAKGLMSLAACEVARNDYDSAFNLCLEVARRADNPSLSLTAARSIAFLKSLEGDHRQALNDLERLAPLARYANPAAYYNYLNSLAIELGEAGRIEEAQNVCKIVLASPYVFAYPEWRETGREIALRGYKSRSAVSLTSKKLENVLYLPERDPLTDTSTRSEPASVLDYLEWKKKMGKKRNGNHEDKKSPQGKTEKELFFELTEIISKRQFDSEQLCKLIDFADKISSKPDPEPGQD